MEVSQGDARLQEGQEGGSGKPQACQPDLGAGEDYEADYLECITQHVPDTRGISPSQHRVMKGRSCLTNLISFYKITCLGDEGKAVDVVYLDLSKAFDTISHSILLEELAAHSLHGCTLCSVKNWLDS